MVVFSSVALLWLGAGCATTNSRTTERRLAASGFKVVPATTPAQQQQLATLPAGKVSVVNRNGNAYFVYPDRSQNLLYVGTNPQYDAYQRLLLDDQARKQSLAADAASSNAEILNAEATAVSNAPWGFVGEGVVVGDPWGVWGPWPFY
ncbi:MAG TPA: hypothetical protein DCE44_01610 [Verrucomicrobiales bacterium]|nr:hypothetical protein [Verrucomicrobiales bacterium]